MIRGSLHFSGIMKGYIERYRIYNLVYGHVRVLLNEGGIWQANHVNTSYNG